MGRSFWERSVNQMKRWLNIGLCTLLALQTFLFSPGLARAITDTTPPTIDTFTAAASGGFFEQEIGGTFYTNDTTPTINATYSDIGGSFIDATTASVRVDTDSAGFDSRDGSGISATLPALPNATYSIEVVVKDGAGNEGIATKSLIIDTASPSAPVITAPGAVTSNNQTPTVSGTTEADSTVNIYDGVSLVATDATTPAGTFSVATSSLAEGAHTLTATATDRAGNISGSSASVVYIVDVTNPTVDAGTDKIINASTLQDATVSDASGIASFAWSKVSGPGTVTFGTPTAEDTNISADTNGVYDLRLTATDNAGNSASDDISFTWNSANPAVSIDAIASPSNDTTPTITGTATDPYSNIASVDYRIDGGSWTSAAPADGSFNGLSEGYTLTTAALAEGSHLVEVRATDVLGNVATSGFTSRTFVIDTTAPVITLNGSATVTVEAGTAYTELDAGWTDAVDGAGTATVSGSVNTSVVGDYTISYDKTDTAGNAATTVTRTVQVRDTLKPTISGITPTDGTITSDASVVVSATFADSGSGVDTSSLWLDVDGIPSEGSASFIGNTFTYAPGTYDDGLHTVDVSISDNVGNRMDTVSWSFTVTSAPTISSATVSGGRVVPTYINATNTGLNVSGSVPFDSDTQTVQLFVNGSDTPLASTIVLSPATTYSIDLSTDEFNSLKSTEGLRQLKVRRIGSTGNVSGYSSFFDIFVDVTLPATPDGSKINVGQNAPGNNDTVTGSAGASTETGGEIYLYKADGTTEITHGAVAGDGSFGPLSIGDNANDTAKVAVRDVAGNESGTVTELNDTVAPADPVITSPTDLTISNVASFTVTGTAEAGTSVTIYNDAVFGTGLADGDGNFSIPITLPGDAVYNLKAKAVDTAGNQSGPSTSVQYTLDTVAPTATVLSPANLALTNNNMTPVAVTWSDGAGSGFAADPTRTMTVGVLPKTTAWNGSDTMTYTPSSSSSDGVKTVTATIADKAGNVGTVSFSFTIDTVAPVIAAHDDLTVEATSSAGATVTYTAPNATDNVDATAPAVCTPDSGSVFPLGTTGVTCTKTDAAGNSATPTHFNVIVHDTTKPIVALTGVTPVTVEVHSSYTDDGATWTDAVDGTGAAIKTGSVDVDTLGTYTLHYNYTDAAGNVADELTRTVNVVDTTKPVIAAHGDETADPTSSAGVTVTYTAPGVTDNYDAPFTATCLPASGSLFPIGTTTVTCNAADSNGNAADPVTFHVIVTDSTAPTIDTITGTAGTTGESTLVTVNATDNVAPTSATIAIDGGAPVAMTGTASPFTYDMPVPSGSIASINYVVTVYDAAGNVVTSGTQTITVTDNDAPVGTIGLMANTTSNISDPTLYTRAAALKLTTSATDNIGVATMAFKDDQSAGYSGPVAYAASSTFAYNLSGTTKGTRTVYVKYCDAASNCFETTGTIIYDTTAPSNTLINPIDGTYTNNKQLQFSWSAINDSPLAPAVNSGIQYYQVTVQKYNTGTSTWGNVTGLASLNAGLATSYQLSVPQSSSLTDDEYRANVQARDNAGNLSTSKYSDGVVLDTVAPVVTLTGSTPVPVERGTSYTELGATWTDAVDGSGAAVVTGAVDPNTVGDYTIHYNYTDRAGNAATEVTRTVNVVDTIAPTVTQVTPVTTPTNNPHYTFNTDEAGTISYGGACSATTATTTATVGSNDVALTGLGSGVYSDCTVTVTDAYGNPSSPLSIPSFTIDKTAPTVTVNNLLTKDTTPPLSGTVNDPTATVSIRVNGLDYPAVNDGAGHWNIADNALFLLADGIYDVAATATDALGNVGTDATTNELKIDNAAPIVLSVSPSGTISNRQPVISATLSDPIAGVNAATMVMRINGVAVATSYNPATGVLSFTPTRDMALRTYTVTIDGKDNLGNTMTRYSWSFSIGSGV